MTETRVEELETEAEWTAALPILRQLWTDADEAFVRSWADEDGYRLFGLYADRSDPAEPTESADPAELTESADPAELTEPGDPAEPTELADEADRAESEALVAVAGVSIQRVLHHARHAWIHDFVVDEARRGEGFGAELLSFVESWADDRDCEYVALAVREGNDDALGFYDAAGMEQWGRVVEREL